MTVKRAITLGVAAVGLAACGGGTSSPSTSSAPGGTSPAGSSSSASSATTVGTGSTSLGTVLTDAATGRTLYYFTPEKGSKAVCAADASCNAAWPPETASGTPTGPSSATGTFGTVALPGGQSEVTYNGWPLHTYSGDSAAGQTNGQGIEGKWFVATPGLTAAGGGTGSGGNSPSASSGGGY